MTFLNATLLFGCLAAVFPLIFHFLGRREPQQVTFPAIRFLTKRIETTRRKIQVKRWVLLAMRIGVILAFALALAQPEIHRAVVGRWLGVGIVGSIGLLVLVLALWAIATGRAGSIRVGLFGLGGLLTIGAIIWGGMTALLGPKPQSVASSPAAIVILVDNGPTSEYQIAADQSRLDRAKEWAKWVMSRYPSESRFAILDRSSRPVAFSLDAASAQKGLQKLDVLQSPSDLAERIEAGIDLLRTSQLTRKVMIVFSDLTETAWGSAVAENPESQRLAAKLDESPSVFLQIVDIGSEEFRNRMIGSLEMSDSTPARDATSTISVVVDRESTPSSQASSSVPEETATVQMRLFSSESSLPVYRDDVVVYPSTRTVDRQTVRIVDGGAQASLTLPPLPVGYHHGLIEIVEPDAVRIDNVRYFTVRVAPPRRVLIVANDVNERRIIALMLNPRGDDDFRREYDLDFVSSNALQEKSFDGYEAIGIFNPSPLVPLARDRLENWVRDGGKLFVSLGPDLGESDSPEVSQWELVGKPRRVWRVPDPGTYMQIVAASHVSLSSLASVPGGAPWNAFRVYQYWQLEQEGQFQTLLRYAGRDHMALGERRLDQGRVMVMTTPLPALTDLARPWNDLLSSTATGAWEVFLVLISQVFEDLTGGKQPELNSQVGAPVALALSTADSRRWQLFAPDSPPSAIDSDQSFVVPGTPLVAGNYWLRSASGEAIGYSANLPRLKTRLARTDEVTLNTLFGQDKYILVKDRENIQLGDGGATDGKPIYSLVMLVVFSLFMLESILANRFYQKTRRTSKESHRNAWSLLNGLKTRLGNLVASRGLG